MQINTNNVKKANQLQSGDVVASGETVIQVANTLGDKLLVVLDRGGKRRVAAWKRHSTIFMQRKA